MFNEVSSYSDSKIVKNASERKGTLPNTKILEKWDVEKRFVTPEWAANARLNWQFPNQRLLSKTNIERLAYEQGKGYFVVGMPIFVCILPTGEKYLVNGNHTLEAIIKNGVGYPLTVIYLQVGSLAEAGRVYANLDIQKIRTLLQSIRAAGLSQDVPYLAKAKSAITVISNEFKNQSFSANGRTDIIEMLQDYTQHISTFASILHGKPNGTAKYCFRAPVFAVALETIRYQPSAAFEFWELVASGEVLSPNPAKALLRWFDNNKSTSGSSTQLQQAKACAVAWNAWFRGRHLVIVRPTGDFELFGTPWKAAK